jgi:hypothetical protein
VIEIAVEITKEIMRKTKKISSHRSIVQIIYFSARLLCVNFHLKLKEKCLLNICDFYQQKTIDDNEDNNF